MYGPLLRVLQGRIACWGWEALTSLPRAYIPSQREGSSSGRVVVVATVSAGQQAAKVVKNCAVGCVLLSEFQLGLGLLPELLYWL